MPKKKPLEKDIQCLISVDKLLKELTHQERIRVLRFLIAKYTVSII